MKEQNTYVDKKVYEQLDVVFKKSTVRKERGGTSEGKEEDENQEQKQGRKEEWRGSKELEASTTSQQAWKRKTKSMDELLSMGI